jgi:hypothetical protein
MNLTLQREVIVKIVSIETETTFCYAVVTKFGRVGVYDGHLQLLDSYVIALGEGDICERVGDMDGVDRRRRVKTIWLTDAVHLPDANALLLVCSDRSLHIYDCSCLIHAPLYLVRGMRHVPQCLAYTVGSGGNPSMLFIGDSAGNVTTLRFQQPRVSLFRKKHQDKLGKFYWMVCHWDFSAPFSEDDCELTDFDEICYSKEFDIETYKEHLILSLIDQGWTFGVLGFDSRRELRIFLLTTASRTALGPTQPPIQWVPGVLSLGANRPGREADHTFI